MGEGAQCVPTPSDTSNMEMRLCELSDYARGGWNVEQVQHTFIEAEWQQVLGLSRFWPDDRIYWWPSRNGIFNVRSCYWLGRLGHLRTWRLQYGERETELWHEVWRVEGPPKINHFMWRACKGSLVVKERLHARHITDTTSCSICSSLNESISHALFDCSFAHAIWQANSFTQLLIEAPSSYFVDNFEWLAKRCTRDDFRSIYALMCAGRYCRNKELFENLSLDSPNIACHLSKMVEDYCLYAKNVFNGNVGCCGSSSLWSPSSMGPLKVNFHAHVSPNGEVGPGVVVRKSTGRIIMLGVKRVAIM